MKKLLITLYSVLCALQSLYHTYEKPLKLDIMNLTYFFAEQVSLIQNLELMTILTIKDKIRICEQSISIA